MRHIDLFSGIAGFAYAAREVWGDDYENVLFCDNNKFCQEIIRKNFGKGSVIIDDIRKVTKEWLVANATRTRTGQDKRGLRSVPDGYSNGQEIDLLTGGFPCQPFSQAGKRGGKSDDRYLWPEMLRIIKEFRPRWIIGENVGGLGTMAQQRGDAPLEGQADNEDSADNDTFADGVLCEIIDSIKCLGYTVQAFVIPACAVGAPHRRDRIWIVAHSNSAEHRTGAVQVREQNSVPKKHRKEICGGIVSRTDSDRPSPHTPRLGQRGRAGQERHSELEGRVQPSKQAGSDVRGQGQGCDCDVAGLPRAGLEGKTGASVQRRSAGFAVNACNVADSGNERLQRGKRRKSFQEGQTLTYGTATERGGNTQWDENWTSASSRLCALDDGIPGGLAGLAKGVRGGYRVIPGGKEGENLITASNWREEALKAAGNAIVPQVVKEIMLVIKAGEDGNDLVDIGASLDTPPPTIL